VVQVAECVRLEFHFIVSCVKEVICQFNHLDCDGYNFIDLLNHQAAVVVQVLVRLILVLDAGSVSEELLARLRGVMGSWLCFCILTVHLCLFNEHFIPGSAQDSLYAYLVLDCTRSREEPVATLPFFTCFRMPVLKGFNLLMVIILNQTFVVWILR